MPPDRLNLPPEHLLGDETVAAAAHAWATATEQHDAARRERVEAEQRELVEAQEADRQADVTALEAGKPMPKGKPHEVKARDRIEHLTRHEEAAATLAARAHAALLEAIDLGQSRIAEHAERNRVEALAEYGRAVDQLAAATATLTEAHALTGWARDPRANFKVRGLRVPLARHGSDAPTADAVLAALRQVAAPPPPPEPGAGPVEQPLPVGRSSTAKARA